MSLGHDGHAPGEFSSACRACRIAGGLARIEELAGVDPLKTVILPPPEDPAKVAARSFLGRFVFTDGQRTALRRCAAVGMSAQEVSEHVDRCARDVGGPRRV